MIANQTTPYSTPIMWFQYHRERGSSCVKKTKRHHEHYHESQKDVLQREEEEAGRRRWCSREWEGNVGRAEPGDTGSHLHTYPCRAEDRSVIAGLQVVVPMPLWAILLGRHRHRAMVSQDKPHSFQNRLRRLKLVRRTKGTVRRLSAFKLGDRGFAFIANWFVPYNYLKNLFFHFFILVIWILLIVWCFLRLFNCLFVKKTGEDLMNDTDTNQSS